MQDGSGHLRHAGEARSVNKFFMQLFEADFGFLERGDVLGNAERADDFALAVAQRPLGTQSPQHRAVLHRLVLDLADDGLAGADDFLFVVVGGLGVAFAKKVEIAFTDNFLRRHAMPFELGLAAAQETGLLVLKINAVRGMIEQGAKEFMVIRENGVIGAGRWLASPFRVGRCWPLKNRFCFHLMTRQFRGLPGLVLIV